MVRLVMMGGKWYGLRVDDINDDWENIQTFVEEGTSVMLCYDLANARDHLGPDADIEMVE